MADPVGRTIWAFVYGSEKIAAVEAGIRAGKVSAVWLDCTNMTDAAETTRLVNRLQGAAAEPLIIGVDAEAGLGHVVDGGTMLPTAMALGATRDARLARDAGVVTAAEAAATGINSIGAPVLDVNVNPENPIINTRSFGEDRELVAKMGIAFCEGMAGVDQPGRVVPIGKHFPGHGATSWDSHLKLGIVDRSASELEEVELWPFRAAIHNRIPMLMTAHVAYPALDPDEATPATLSRPIMTDLLRRQLGFRGALVTDCMNMHAVSKNFEEGEAAVLAMIAGCDLIMADNWERAYQALTEAVNTGRIPFDRLNEAGERVLAAKRLIFGTQLRKPGILDPAQATATVGSAVHHAVAKRIAEASVTVLEGEVPQSGRPLIVATDMDRKFGRSVDRQLREILAGLGGEVEVLNVAETPGIDDFQRVSRAAAGADWVALLHFNRVESYVPDAIATRVGLVKLASLVGQIGRPLVAVSLGSPYALGGFIGAQAKVCSYSTSDASVEATLKVILRKAQARSVSRPVT